MVSKICTLQHNGDKAVNTSLNLKYTANCLDIKVVDAELERLGVLTEQTSASLARLEGIPVDIRPCYPLAGETCVTDNTRTVVGS